MKRYRGRGKQRVKIVLAAGFLLLAIAVGCGLYLREHYPAGEAALIALEPDAEVTVLADGNTTAFIPEDGAELGFVFYPGAKVEHTAYAPLLRQLAEEGVLCVLVEMPFRLAVLDQNAAKKIPGQYPEVTEWYIGGHSLGGSMAAACAADHGELFEGLVLLAAYSTEDLRETGLRVLSAYGSEDGVLDLENYEEYRGNLPESVSETVIDGGNHACFGNYGPQDGDGTPRITAEQQMKETAELLLDFFRDRTAGGPRLP